MLLTAIVRSDSFFEQMLQVHGKYFGGLTRILCETNSAPRTSSAVLQSTAGFHKVLLLFFCQLHEYMSDLNSTVEEDYSCVRVFKLFYVVCWFKDVYGHT